MSSALAASAGYWTCPTRSNMKATLFISPRLPPYLLKAERIAEAARLRLSVRTSTIMATPRGTVAFVANFLVGIGVAVAAALLHGPVDIVVRHVLRLGGGDRGAQARVHIGVGASPRCDHDFLGMPGKDLGALGILRAFPVHDILEFGMAGHVGWRSFRIDRIVELNKPVQSPETYYILYRLRRFCSHYALPTGSRHQAAPMSGIAFASRGPTRTASIRVARPVASSVST